MATSSLILINMICHCRACQLTDNMTVPFWFALKPPHGYGLHVLSWNGSKFAETRSNLQLRINPVFQTLYGHQHRVLGMPCVACRTSAVLHAVACIAKLSG